MLCALWKQGRKKKGKKKQANENSWRNSHVSQPRANAAPTPHRSLTGDCDAAKESPVSPDNIVPNNVLASSLPALHVLQNKLMIKATSNITISVH